MRTGVAPVASPPPLGDGERGEESAGQRRGASLVADQPTQRAAESALGGSLAAALPGRLAAAVAGAVRTACHIVARGGASAPEVGSDERLDRRGDPTAHAELRAVGIAPPGDGGDALGAGCAGERWAAAVSAAGAALRRYLAEAEGDRVERIDGDLHAAAKGIARIALGLAIAEDLHRIANIEIVGLGGRKRDRRWQQGRFGDGELEQAEVVIPTVVARVDLDGSREDVVMDRRRIGAIRRRRAIDAEHDLLGPREGRAAVRRGEHGAPVFSNLDERPGAGAEPAHDRDDGGVEGIDVSTDDRAPVLVNALLERIHGVKGAGGEREQR
ncbi:hypothetical protein SCE1572_31860 [Sorangium cellulosum So0157-2]|uniref:Uncharacterized protein n=1 Tax=Sorangium cellulosum So0157-2 TaxID=1254432 RepID=S4Y398_SORCE|nr:hypothetical protein [Sorangium cellulosum]AGP38675.1 hypothetical protein SCE1572_31860 [Sorangium cellulosum So0157-2]